MARTIFIGDIHGCLDELLELLDRLDVSSRDRVICIGDLINKGPQSAGVVRTVYEYGFECLRGNHDDSYLRHPLNRRYRDLHDALPGKVRKWYQSLPLFIEERRFIAVHAGLQPGKAPAKTSPRILMSIRTWDGKGDNLNRPQDPPWYKFYRQNRPVIYGHWAAEGLNIRTATIGLDSGCAYGNKLTAYVLEKKRIIQVQARQTYAQVDK